MFAQTSFTFADDCPAGNVLITDATRADATAAGIPTSATCWNPGDTNAGAATGEAKQYLTSILKGGSCGPYRTTAEGLDPRFAICAANFMKALRAKDPNFYVISMYRSAAHQAFLCGGGCGRVNGPCAPAGGSKHQQGIAIDISNGQYIVPDWVHQMGQGYGIIFPVRNDSGHFQPQPGSNCADPNFKPTDTSGVVGAPFDQQIRRALGLNPPPPPAPQVQTTPTPVVTPTAPLQIPPPLGTLNTTPLLPGTCTPQNYCHSDGNIYYRASTCVDQIYQQCSSGCSGVVCNGTSTSLSISNLLSSTGTTSGTQNQNTNTNKNGTSTFDLINQYANPITSVDIGTATPVVLNPDTSNSIGSLQGTLSQTTGTLYASGTASGVATIGSQQTFTSGDLGNTGAPTYTQGQNTFALQILDSLKNALLGALQYLRPFGGQIPNQNQTNLSE